MGKFVRGNHEEDGLADRAQRLWGQHFIASNRAKSDLIVWMLGVFEVDSHSDLFGSERNRQPMNLS